MRSRVTCLVVLLGVVVLSLLLLVFSSSYTRVLLPLRVSTTAQSYLLLKVRRESPVPGQNGSEPLLDRSSDRPPQQHLLKLFSYNSKKGYTESKRKAAPKKDDITSPKEPQKDDITSPKEAKCNDSICLEYLSAEEKESFRWCVRKTLQQEEKYGPIVPGTCHFMNGSARHPVALASAPGSGNTWVRGLLEKVTGICSGALYCDGAFRTKGFTGEGVKGSSVIVVKTHNLHPQFVGDQVSVGSRNGIYGSAILLVRNPLNALVSDWHRGRSNQKVNRTASNHFLYVGEDWFGHNKAWNKSVSLKGSRWQKQVLAWMKRSKDRQVLVVQYERLKNDTVGEVKRMLDFLGFTYTREEISRRLKEGFTAFYRNHHDEFEHFTPAQKTYLTSMLTETAQILKEYHVGDILPIHDYL